MGLKFYSLSSWLDRAHAPLTESGAGCAHKRASFPLHCIWFDEAIPRRPPPNSSPNAPRMAAARYNQDRLVKNAVLPSALEILVRDFRIMHRLTRTQNTIELKA